MAGTRALFLDLDRATQVDGMRIEKGRALRRSQQDYAQVNAPACKHRWPADDVLVWDNSSVQHKAEGSFELGESRRLWRSVVEGERPSRDGSPGRIA